MTFLSPLLMVGVFALVAYLSSVNKENIRTISILDKTENFAKEFKSTKSLKYNILALSTTIDEAKKKSEEAGDYALLYIPKMDVKELQNSIKLFSEDSPSPETLSVVEEVIKDKVEDIRLEKAGVNVEEFRNFNFKLKTNLETYKGEETSKEGIFAKLIFGGIAGYLLFMFIIIYGNMIMRSVIEEKTSRIIEVIISSVKPTKLMLGKIFGTSLAGITQVIAWIIVGSVISTIAISFFGLEGLDFTASQEELLAANPDVNELFIKGGKAMFSLPLFNLIIMFIFFFLGGYLLYASLYAAIGAAVDNETDTQQFMMPVLIPLILAVYVGFFTVIDNPHGTVSQIFSYIPLTSPVVMLMRIPFGVPLWQQILSVVILFATFLGTVWFAAKIYRVGILMYGKKPSYKELFKWLKY